PLRLARRRASRDVEHGVGRRIDDPRHQLAHRRHRTRPRRGRGLQRDQRGAERKGGGSHARIIASPVTLLPYCEWLASTRWSIALHESLYMYPLVESVHVLTLCLFVGMSVMLDLRLLGIALRRVPVAEVTDRLVPWMVAGFIVMVITGVLLFYAI